MTSAPVIDVTAANFQQVVEQSKTIPVLLDFWADWCGPCKTLGPVLEKLADEFGGSFLLGKVDTEKEQDLAYAFQVQGIPFCVLVDGGRPVDGFQGAVPESEVRRFLQKHGIGPAAGAAEPAAEPVDPDAPEGRLQRALTAAGGGDAAAARAALEDFPEEDELFGSVQRLGDALAFLEAELEAGKPGVEGVLANARSTLLAGEPDAAMEQILEAVAQDKSFREGLPRRAMLLCFLLVGEDDERLDPYRRRLATLLY